LIADRFSSAFNERNATIPTAVCANHSVAACAITSRQHYTICVFIKQASITFCWILMKD